MSLRRPTRFLTGIAVVCLLAVSQRADSASTVPEPRPKPDAGTTGTVTTAAAKTKAKAKTTATAAAKPTTPLPIAATSTTSAVDVAAAKEAVSLARHGKSAQATEIQNTIGDPLARKLVEWAILRSDDSTVDFSRYVAFLAENPTWPSTGLLRRRAEGTLWQERLDPSVVRTFFAKDRPLTAKGKFALARALLLQGDRAGAQSHVRDAWRNENFSAELENQALDVFRDLITTADHKARMDMRLYAEDADGGLRSANRAGGNAPAIAKARIAVIKKAANAKALLDAVPADARRDAGYIFSSAQLLRRSDKAAEAAALMLTVPQDPNQAIDTDQWWVERRLVARKLLDLGDPKTAYRIAREAAVPGKDNYRAESQFTAGWIALRFLNDPATALPHFVKIGQASTNPIALARSGYWQGRATEELGRKDEARAHYEAAARYSTAYYGQIARARLGHKDIVVRPPPAPAPAALEIVRAVEILYAIDERDLVASVAVDLGERSNDTAGARSACGVHRAAQGRARAAAARQGRAQPRPAVRPIRLPDRRPAGIPRHRTGHRAVDRLRHRAPGKHVQSARGLGRARHGPDAGDARPPRATWRRSSASRMTRSGC